MRRAAATRACQFLWLLLGLTLVVEGRMLPTGRPNSFEPCQYSWQLPARDCWPPIGQSPTCDHLYNKDCGGSPPTVPSKTTASADQLQAVAMELEDPDCKPVPGRLPPIHCQDPSVQVTKGDFSHNLWTEVQEDRTDLQIHCEGCQNWPPAVTHHVNQDKTLTAAATMELEDPDCRPLPGRLPPIHCQDPPMLAEGGSIQTAKGIEACQYTWQLPGRDCWPPIGQSPHCDHLMDGGCGNSPPTRN